MTTDPGSASHAHVSRALLGYYLSHPDAVETTEGLARWRLVEEFVERTVRETEGAVTDLVERGFLIQTTRAGGQPLFTMNRERVDDARAFVEGAREGEGDGDR